MCQRWRAGAAGLDQASQWQCGWGGGEAANTTEQFWYLKDHLSFERTPFWCLSPQCYAWHHFFLERTSRPPRIPWQGLFFQVPAWKSDLTIWANPTASFYFSDVDQKKIKPLKVDEKYKAITKQTNRFWAADSWPRFGPGRLMSFLFRKQRLQVERAATFQLVWVWKSKLDLVNAVEGWRLCSVSSVYN